MINKNNEDEKAVLKKMKLERSSSFLGTCGLIRVLTNSLNYYLTMDFENSMKDYAMLSRIKTEVLHMVDEEGKNFNFDIGTTPPCKYLSIKESDNVKLHRCTSEDIAASINNGWVSLMIPTLSPSANGDDINLYKSLMVFVNKEVYNTYYFAIDNDRTVVDIRSTPIYLAYKYIKKDTKTLSMLSNMIGIDISDEDQISSHIKQSDRFKSKVILIPIQCVPEIKSRVPELANDNRWKPILLTSDSFEQEYAFIMSDVIKHD